MEGRLQTETNWESASEERNKVTKSGTCPKVTIGVCRLLQVTVRFLERFGRFRGSRAWAGLFCRSHEMQRPAKSCKNLQIYFRIPFDLQAIPLLFGLWRCCSSITDRCEYAQSSRLA